MPLPARPGTARGRRAFAILAIAFAALASPAARAAAACEAVTSAVDARQQKWLRGLVREVALREGVDPLALEALGITETGLRPSVGRACELGAFQVMQSWARVFQLDSPALLSDPRINAIAAARIYKAGWRRWKPRYAQLGRNRAMRAAGWTAATLDRESFAALAYNWGRAPSAFAHQADLREVPIPPSSAAYAVRFSRALQQARQLVRRMARHARQARPARQARKTSLELRRWRAGSDTPRGPSPSSRAGARAAS